MNENIQNQIDELSRNINLQNERIVALENKPIRLDRSLDNSSKDIIEDVVSERILDIVWNDYIYYSSFFESADRYYTTASGTFQGVTSNGLELTTTAANGNETELTLPIVSQKTITNTKDSRFRVVTKINTVSGATSYILTHANGLGISDHYAGFKIVDGAISGVTGNGSEGTVSLGSVANNTWVKLDLKYYPNKKVVFFVNDVEKGTLATNMPTDNTNIAVFSATLGNTTAASRTLYVEYFEFLQSRN